MLERDRDLSSCPPPLQTGEAKANAELSPEASTPQISQPPSRRHGVDLTQGNLLRGIVMLSWPIVTGAVLNWVMGVADIKMVGSLGPEAIAAVGQAQGIIQAITAIILAVATGTQVLVARYTGAGQRDKVAEVTRQSIIICFIFGMILIPLGMLLSGPALAKLGVSSTVLQEGTIYTNAFFWGAIGLMINFMISSALQGAGDTLTPMLMLAWINLAHIGLEYMLIFGIGPFPRMGVAGAAWAVVVSRGLAAIFLLWVVTSGRFAIKVPLRHSWRIDWAIWSRMFYIGIPSSLQGMTRSVSYLMLAFVLNHTFARDAAISGHTAAGQWGALGIFVGLSMMTAAMTAVGQNMGACNPKRAEESCWSVVWVSTVSSIILGGLCILFGKPLIGFFTTDTQSLYWGYWALVFLSAFLPFSTISMAFSGGLRGAGDTLSPLWATLISNLLIGPGLAYLLALTLNMGPIGAWLGLAISMVVQALITGFIFKRGKWKRIVI